MKHKSFLTPNEVAELLMVSPVTVRQWAQKGYLKAESTPGGHRRFLRQEIERFAREHQLSLQQPDRDELRILIVDDDPLVAESFTALFEEFPAVITETAGDGFTAGQKMQTFQPHIILLDLLMPGLDGFTICQRLKADPTTRTVRIIAMTAYPSEDNIQRILAAGAEACLAKPADINRLLALIGLTDQRSSGSRQKC